MCPRRKAESRAVRAKQPGEKTGPVEPERAGFDSGPLILAGIFIFFYVALVGLGPMSPSTQRIVGVDPVGYYAWIRSMLFDHDIQFENEYRTLNPPELIEPDSVVNPDGPRTITNHLPNIWSIGPGLMWAPFMLIGHAFAAWTGAPLDGFSQPYFYAVYVGNALYGLGGALLTYFAVRTWFGKRLSLLATIAAWTCSPALYYTFAQETMSHACSFFTAALVLLLWARLRERDAFWPWACIGAALGLTMLVRWHNVTLCAIPAVDLLWTRRARDGAKLAVCAAMAVVAFIPQMIGWKALYGLYITIPQGSGFMSWTRPNVFNILFSTSYGLITWTPLCAVGLVGVLVWPKDKRRVFAALAIAVLLQLYVLSVAAGTPGWSFGMRRLVNCVPLFAVGFAAVFAKPGVQRLRPLIFILIFATWNTLFILQYTGILDPIYINDAMTALGQKYDLDPSRLLLMKQLPDGQPFNYFIFGQEHRFPRDGDLTFTQLVTDKFTVLFVLFFDVFGYGDSG